MEVSDQIHAQAALHPPLPPRGEKDPGSHCIGVWVGPKSTLVNVKKKSKFFILPGLEIRPLSRPACDQ
jgi:hypothetical protein